MKERGNEKRRKKKIPKDKQIKKEEERNKCKREKRKIKIIRVVCKKGKRKGQKQTLET